MRLFLLILFPILVFPQKIDLKKIELGKRNEKYRVWVYFIDKQGSEPILLNSKTVQRRMKNGISNNSGWYDTPVSPAGETGVSYQPELLEIPFFILLCTVFEFNRIGSDPCLSIK